MSPHCLRTAPIRSDKRALGGLELTSPCSAPQRGSGSHRGCYLHAVVVSALPVEVAAVVVHTAVVQGAETHEAVLQGVISLLVHVVMPNHVLFTGESLQRYKRQTVRHT